jgi:bifunctional non-homologous end joining protein LigD
MKENKFDGLYLGRRSGEGLVYAAKVDHGFDGVSAKDLRARLKPLVRKTQPYAKRIAHRGIWVEPSLLAESNTRRSPPRVRCGIRFSRASARISDGQGRV